MNLGAFSINLAVKDIAASRACHERFRNPALVDQHV